jgi:phosphoribosylanthranilate isomerase
MPSVWIKICGVTTPTDAVFAADYGADAVGLNFYPKSRRHITNEQADSIVRELPPTVTRVGVFVDTSPDDMRRCAARFGLHAIQVYQEPVINPSAAVIVPPLGPATWVIAAFRVRDEFNLQAIEESLSEIAGPCGSVVLLDSYVSGEMGGTGHKAPWDLIAKSNFGVPLILAGGLTPDNVAEAIRTVRPWGVDVASGVESAPGKKDPGKVRAFIQAARAAAADLPDPPPPP